MSKNSLHLYATDIHGDLVHDANCWCACSDKVQVTLDEECSYYWLKGADGE